jgi:hypothetical protein
MENNITINATPGMSEKDLTDKVAQKFEEIEERKNQEAYQALTSARPSPA